MSDQLDDDTVPQLGREQLASQIEALLAGRLGAAALAAWAFDQFYAEELGDLAYEPGAEETIAEALDALMFGDDPGFSLEDAALRDLVGRLRNQ